MASFGSFETEREISSTPEALVFTARKAGESGAPGYALKLFTPPPAEESLSLLGAVQSAGSSWDATAVQRIELQKKAAASPLIVPVLESGRDERGVWCVTPLYPHSVQLLLAGRVALNREAIHRILLSVARGALACKQQCGRAHGGIKPSNILLGNADLKGSEIRLSDPAAGTDGDAARIERADMRGLGLVLYQLVRRRELADTADWLVQQIEISAEWSALFGRSAAAWLALCNRLLDPALTLETFDLEKLDTALAALEPKPAVSRRAWAAAAAVVALVALGVGVLVGQRSRGTLEITINVPDAQVTVTKAGGESVSKPARQNSPLKLRLAAGEYVVVGAARDLEPVTNDVQLVGGKLTQRRLDFDFGSLTVKSDTAGALVSFGPITNAPLPYSNPYARPGVIKLQVRKDGFIPADLSGVVVSGKPLLIETNLERLPDNTVLVRLVSYPGGAQFFQGGQTIDRPQIPLSYGQHVITARYHQWKEEITRTLDVREQSGELVVEFRFQSTKVGFDCELSNVTMYVNRIRYTNYSGLPPYTNSLVPSAPSYDYFEPGETSFTFEAPGYKTNPPTVLDLVAGQQTNVSVHLAPLGGFVEITSEPSGASLWTNGVRVAGPTGQTPTALLLPAGDYELMATYAGLAPKKLDRIAVANGMKLSRSFIFDFGGVRLESDPAQGTVFYWISNDVLNAVPIPPLFAPGEYKFVASNSIPGLTNVVRDHRVARSSTNLLVMRFNYATVIVTSVPPTGPLVSFGSDTPHGTPWTYPIVPFGPHEYTLTFSNKPAGHRRVLINATNTVIVWHNFDRLPPVTNLLGTRFEFIPENRIFVSRYETTVGEFRSVLPTNAIGASEDPNEPARQVKWRSAQEFCKALQANPKIGEFKPVELDQQVNRNDYEYGIPTEEEWNSYQDAIPGKVVTSGTKPKPVGGGSVSNRFGLFDVYGNVAEYCTDRSGRIWLMGGSFLTGSNFLVRPRKAESGEITDGGKPTSDVGFRVILRPKR